MIVIIRYSKEALKFLARLDAKSVERIRTAVRGLTKEPPIGDIRPLQGYSDQRMRLRVGGWRVIFRYGSEGEVEILFVLDIGNRGDVYK
jgi:mRNA interferase RelE/StbE